MNLRTPSNKLNVLYLFSYLATGISFPYIPVYMQQIGGSLVLVAILDSLYNTITSFSQIYWAKKSDYSGQRVKYIAIGNIVPGVLFFVYGLSVVPLLLLVIHSIEAFWDASEDPTSNALVFEYSSEKERAKRFTLFITMCTCGYFAGNVIGGYIQAKVRDLRILFIISGVIFFLVGVLSYLLLPETKRWRRKITPWKSYNISEIYNFRGLFRTKLPDKIKILFLGVLFLTIASGITYTYLAIFIAEKFTTELVGILFAVKSLTLVIAIPLCGYLSEVVGKKKMLIFSAVLSTSYSIALFSAQSLNMMIVSQIISGLKWAFFTTTIYSYTAEISEENELALNQGFINFAISIGLAASPLIAGIFVVALNLSFNEVFIMAIAPSVSSLITFSALEKSVKKGPRPYIISGPFTEL